MAVDVAECQKVATRTIDKRAAGRGRFLNLKAQKEGNRISTHQPSEPKVIILLVTPVPLWTDIQCLQGYLINPRTAKCLLLPRTR